MKKINTSPLKISKLTFMLFILFNLLISSPCYAFSDREEITSGAMYDDVISFCPEARLYDSDGVLHMDISALDTSLGEDLTALHIVKITGRLLSSENISDYSDIVVEHHTDDTSATISITSFKNIGSFTSQLTTRSDLEWFDSSLQSYYKRDFGCHDLNIASGDNDGLWLYSSFPLSIAPYNHEAVTLSAYKYEASTIKVTLSSDNTSLEENVTRFLKICERSTQNFLDIYNVGTDQLRFNAFDIIYTDESTSDELVTASYYIENNQLTGNLSFKDLDFLAQYRKSVSSLNETDPSVATEADPEMSSKPVPYSLEFGELLDANPNGGIDMNTLVIKAKIKPNLTNRMTITQNYQNVIKMIQSKDYSQYDAISYWAVADMTDGSERKVISFTVDKNCIDAITNGSIASGKTLEKYLTDLWILPSLQE